MVQIVEAPTAVAYAVGGALQASFPIPFPFDEASDVQVTVDGAAVLWTPAGGAEDSGIWTGAAAVLLSPVSNCSVVVRRGAAVKQDTLFPLSGAFRVKALNREVARLWMCLQDAKLAAAQLLARPAAEAADDALVLPAKAARALHQLGFDAQGRPVAVDASALAVAAVAAAMASVDVSNGQVQALGTPAIRKISTAQADFLNPKQWGAKGDGVQDDTTYIQQALDDGRNIALPRGLWLNSGLRMKYSSQSLIGVGRDQTALLCTAPAVPVVGFDTGISLVQLGGMTLKHTGTPVAGGHGLAAGGTQSQCRIFDLKAVNNWQGFRLGGTDYSLATDLIAERNLDQGFFLFNNGPAPSQWYGRDWLAQLNAGSGFLLQAAAGGGATAMSVGDLVGLRSYGNQAFGFAAIGLAGVPIQGLRLRGFFFGEDGNTACHLDTFGGMHCLSDGFCELAGRGLTGPTQSQAATNVGNGVRITANNQDVSLESVRTDGNSNEGISTAAAKTRITGGASTRNGRSLAAGTRIGVRHVAGSLAMTGHSCPGDGAVQEYGLVAADGQMVSVMGGDFDGNLVANLSFAANPNLASVAGILPQGSNASFPGGVAIGTVGVLAPNTLNVGAGIFKNGTAYSNP